ncbi:MAG: acyl carrier protein [Clostridia bacterium]
MIFEKITQLIADQLGVDINELKPETDLKVDLKADSLDVVEIIMDIESEFGITVEDEKVMALVTIKDVVDYISSLTK